MTARPMRLPWNSIRLSCFHLHIRSENSSCHWLCLPKFPPRSSRTRSKRLYWNRKSLCQRESISSQKGNKSKSKDRRWNWSTSNHSSNDRTKLRWTRILRYRATRDAGDKSNCCPDHKSNRAKSCFSNRLLSLGKLSRERLEPSSYRREVG